MIGKSLYAILRLNTSVNALVGTRIYPTLAPQRAAFPLIIYRTDQLKPLSCRTPGGYFQGDIELYALAKDFAVAQDVINRVQAALTEYQGTVEGKTIRIGQPVQLDPAFDDKLETYECAIQFNVIGKDN